MVLLVFGWSPYKVQINLRAGSYDDHVHLVCGECSLTPELKHKSSQPSTSAEFAGVPSPDTIEVHREFDVIGFEVLLGFFVANSKCIKILRWKQT